MNKLLVLTIACLMAAGAASAGSLDEGLASAKALADKQDFLGAAAVISTLDTEGLGQSNWPDAVYLRARYLARAGQTAAALAALEEAVQYGVSVTASELRKECDFASLREQARFKAAADRLQKRDRLWQDNPAFATPYKPELSEDEKVAGLSKIWSEARFNFAFFDRVPDLDWDATYAAYLPQVRAAKTTEDYYRVLMRFTEALKDGHTVVRPPAELMDRFYGVTDVETRLIQGKVIVTAVTDPALEAKGLHRGAELVTIDGKPTLDYAKTEVAPYVSGFTPQDRDIWQYGFSLLRGSVGQPVHLTLKEASGKTITLDVPRSHNEGLFGYLPKFPASAEFKILDGNVAYLKINEFLDDAGVKALRANAAMISDAKGLIIDIRRNGGGSTGNGRDIVKILADKPFKGSLMRTIAYNGAFRSWSRPAGWYRAPAPVVQPDPALHISTPVVVLIGPRTYSAAEDFLVMFTSTGRGTLIGEATGGSTGNSVVVKLPGGGTAYICTIDDTFADGRRFEGIGIAPDIEVKPTIADIRAGKDPALDRAVSLLKRGR